MSRRRPIVQRSPGPYPIPLFEPEASKAALDQHTSHTGWNASDGETVLVEARLVKTGEPFTTFIDAQGTPVTI